MFDIFERTINIYSIPVVKMKMYKFRDWCNHLLAKRAKVLAILLSIIVMLGAAIVFWVLV